MIAFFTALGSAASIALLGLLVRAAYQRGAKEEVGTGCLECSYSPIWVGLGLAMVTVFPILLTLAVLYSPPATAGEVASVVGIYVLMIGLGLPVLWETSQFRLAVTAEVLNHVSAWRAGQFVRWEEVEEISYRSRGGCFAIKKLDGRVCTVSVYVRRLASFLEKCEQRLPLEKLINAKPGYRILERPFPRNAR